MRGDRLNKERKAHLERQKLIVCGYCGYHHGENVTHNCRRDNRPKGDKWNKPQRGGKREL